MAESGNARSGAEARAAFFLYLFEFVDWTKRDAETGWTLCIAGEDPFGSAALALEGKSVRGRPLLLRRVKTQENLRACHVLYANLASSRLPALVQAVSATDVVVVGEQAELLALGGVLRLIMEGERVSFEINPKVRDREDLRFSSQFLRLARNYRDVSRSQH